ncbi:MAG: DUF2914 domain-containing protein [candidate division Zixibacteria bacterium]|nr:DUF2914 domain-containing protein [candidate division Zixibacteria bacterium]
MTRILFTTMMIILLSATIAVSQDTKPTESAQTITTSALTAEVQICTEITDRACTGGATTFDASVGKLFCWSQITGGAGEMTIKHIWSHAGKVVLEVPLTIKGNRWRTWSSKNIAANQTGEWEVKVVDASGNTIKSVIFTVGEKK